MRTWLTVLQTKLFEIQGTNEFKRSTYRYFERVKTTRSAGRRPVVVLDLDASSHSSTMDLGRGLFSRSLLRRAQSDALKVALNGLPGKDSFGWSSISRSKTCLPRWVRFRSKEALLQECIQVLV